MTVGLGVLTGGSLRGFNLYWLLNWWLAGVGVLLLTRHLGAPLWGCTVAALAFMASGALTGHAQHTSFVHSFAAVPFILWRLDKALAKNRKLPAAQAGAIWGLSALAGYPALTILSLFFAGFWTLGRLLTSRAAGDGLSSAGKGTPAALLNVLQSWVILLVVGLVSLAPTYWAFFVEGNGYSDRVGPLSREVAVASNALDPSALATFSTPQLNVTKSRHRDKLWPYTPISQVSVYFVATALTLAAYSLTDRRNRRWKLFLLVVAILFLASAMGRALPVRGWLYDLLPPFRYFRHAAVFRVYTLLGIAVLAGYGSRDLRERVDRSLPTWSLLAVSATLFLIAALSAAPLLHQYLNPGDGLSAAALLGVFWLGPGAMVALSAAVKPKRRATLLQGLLLGLAVGDAWTALVVSQPVTQTSSPLALRTWKQVRNNHRTDPDLTGRRHARLERSRYGKGLNNRNLAAKEPVFVSYDPFANKTYRYWASSAVLKQIALGDKRVWFAAQAVAMRTDGRNLRTFEDSLARGTPFMPVLPTSDVAEGGQLTNGTSDPASAASMIRLEAAVEIYHPNRVKLSLHAPSNGWVLFTDRFSRGWQASVNAHPTGVVQGAFLFRALPVVEGSNIIDFEFKPAGYPWLLVASWTTLALVASASILEVRRRKWLVRRQT